MKAAALFLACAAVGTLYSPTATAEAPVAVVEDVVGKAPGVEFMDYVEVGRVIKLGPRDSIVLGYMTSCRRETITGGTVTVGREQSTVERGKVERAQVNCDAGRMQPTDRQARQGGATVLRSAVPPITLYSRSPLAEVSGPGTLVIEPADRTGERRTFVLTEANLVRGRFFDLAKGSKPLAPGVVYTASFEGKKIVFKIDEKAKDGATPVVGRLLRID